MMRDMGEVWDTTEPVEVGKDKEKKHYPTVTLKSEQMPELKGKSVGASVNMNIEGEIQEVRKTEKGTDYRIELRECEMTGEKKLDGVEANMRRASEKVEDRLEKTSKEA